MAEIEIRDLVKTYAGASYRATDAVSLTVADGEFVVLVGPSGCGKTTLLRMVAGLEQPDSGSIAIGGKDVTGLPARHRNVSMVFQSYAIFPHMKVRTNIGFGLAMRNTPKAEIAERVARAAEVLELTDYLDRYPAQLSGGQRQRVAVARAIVVDAEVLLMDEPLSNLDALLRLQFRAELKRIVARLGTTTVYVTHDQAEAMSLGDRVAVMRSGRIAQIGPPVDVYDRPSERFVGGFLGAPPMNFLPATVADDGTLAIGAQTLPASDHVASFAGRDILLGVRAENITVGGEGRLAATVDVVEPTGAAVLLTVRVDGHELKVQAPATFRTEPDSVVRLDCPPESLRYYDPETGTALLK
ncbi:ABC transporter ATP-binding protein [Virgisporangium ochraceum]|uniref:Sugar ABC transporter ATP-binding protein n=1 Tax=Virgisporangium ochraceum TaxID=65505 RepID=A0A8J4EGI0_9ACTN|nr:ABC transporter ATP-binding protein [Virgisporangium ochraceum]GIJ74800.1 sugar ABC transporter ATP-binding protein [Virgisporangium ochraceum]